MPPFDFPSSLQEYAIPEKDYLNRHDDVHIICTGAVVFNNEGKLLLVQRAKEEKAFPNVWVDWPSFNHLQELTDARKSQEARWTTQTRPYYMPPHAS